MTKRQAVAQLSHEDIQALVSAAKAAVKAGLSTQERRARRAIKALEQVGSPTR